MQADTAAHGRPADQRWSRLYIADVYLRDAARQALDGAADKLANPRCASLLTEFRDGRGQPLTLQLAELKVDAASYLRLIVFQDGSTRAACTRHGVLAFTVQGSRVIHLCGRDFVRALKQRPEEVHAVIIHEMLHSLGLGENPPSSREITYRVTQRCWN